MNFTNELFTITSKSLGFIFFTSLGVYIMVIILTRITGKRSVSNMSSFDFAMTAAVGSIMATAIISDTENLTYGVLALLMVYGIQLLATLLRHFKWFRKIIDSQPTMVMFEGEMLKSNMKEVQITEHDLKAAMRKANVTKVKNVKAIVLEGTGDLVVMHGDDITKFENWIIEDVKR